MPPRESLPPKLITQVPGPRSRALSARLAAVESRNVTCLEEPPPIFWERAAGANVWDVDGNRYVDLTAAFGVANVGHSHPDVVTAAAQQAESLLHGMGDVHPPRIKVELLEALVRRFPGGGPARAILSCSGSDAVESALKTAALATGRAGVIAFEGAYHGLALGALETTWRSDFRAPFLERLPEVSVFARYGDSEDVERAASHAPVPIGAVLVEPIQGRAGERVPPAGFLSELRALCDREGWLLIVDEIYTGFGRTGRWFACEHDGAVPDLLCAGKGLASGMPISACLGRAEVMDAWPPSTGESLHTQTFLGHPPGCAAALACMEAIAREKLVEKAARDGELALAQLRQRLAGRGSVLEVRGRGLMIGIECDGRERTLATCREALRQGIILLPGGAEGRVLSVTPPLSIEPEILSAALERVAELLEAESP